MGQIRPIDGMIYWLALAIDWGMGRGGLLHTPGIFTFYFSLLSAEKRLAVPYTNQLNFTAFPNIKQKENSQSHYPILSQPSELHRLIFLHIRNEPILIEIKENTAALFLRAHLIIQPSPIFLNPQFDLYPIIMRTGLDKANLMLWLRGRQYDKLIRSNEHVRKVILNVHIPEIGKLSVLVL